MMTLLRRFSLLIFLAFANSALAAKPTCSVANSDPFWADDGTTITAQCPSPCPDGSYLMCDMNEQTEYQCVNGDVVKVGPTRPGSVINQIGECPNPPPPPPPQDCGEHSSGTTWWQDSAQTTTQVCNTCADGSPQNCEMSVQDEYKCVNGQATPTGQTQTGDVIRYVNECLPPPPKACDDHASGTSWWIDSGTQTANCATCWDGSQITCTYTTQVQQTCSDGVTSSTGVTQPGNLVSQNGQCPAQPRNCGEVANGQTTWQDHGQTAPYQCGTCSDGTAQMCIAVQQEEFTCNDGTLVSTGNTRAGTELGHTNTCPNVVSGQETYQVPVGGGKIDVLFVLDTTPIMFKTLVTLGKRFRSLISSWANMDWQVGISNAQPFPDVIGGSAGLLMKLDPGPVAAPKPLMYLTPQQPAANWIFNRNVSYGGRVPLVSHCWFQPFCEFGLSEPMRELTVAFERRNEIYNKGFFRPGATLVPIIVSAHDERFIGMGDFFSVKPKQVIDSFNKRMSFMAGMKAYSIVIPPGDMKCLEHYSDIFDMGFGGIPAESLSNFAKATGGKAISICQKDYAKALASLSEDLRQKISSIQLKQVPYGDSLKITFTPAVSGVTWVVQEKTVIFNKDLPAGTKLSISYLYTP